MTSNTATTEQLQERQESEYLLRVLPIYNAYRKRVGSHEEALRLTFLELQNRIGHALTWPG